MLLIVEFKFSYAEEFYTNETIIKKKLEQFNIEK
jgi:hypothetical protein